VIRKELPEMDSQVLAPLRNDESVTLTLGGEPVTLEPEDVLVSTEQASDWVCGDEGGIQAALSTALTPALIREGMARDFVRHVQQARKDAGLQITDRIRIEYATDDDTVLTMLREWSDYIAAETLADAATARDAATKTVTVGESQVAISIERS
jgi:isoleucyl-tRNA synthetase